MDSQLHEETPYREGRRRGDDGARLCRHSASETRPQRFHARLVLRNPQFLQGLPHVWAILPRAAVTRKKPQKSKIKKPWITQHTWTLIQEREELTKIIVSILKGKYSKQINKNDKDFLNDNKKYMDKKTVEYLFEDTWRFILYNENNNK